MSQPPYLQWPLFSRSSVAAFDRSLTDPEQMARIAGGLEPDRCDRGGDWMLCETKNEVFEGAGDPEKLHTTLETFSNWATHE